MPTHEKILAVGKSGQKATFNPFFSWVGLALDWGVRRFRSNIDMSSNPTEFGVRGQFGWVRFRVVCLLHKTNANPRKKIFAVGKSGPKATFNLFFLGLGWPWVGEFVVS